MVVVGGSRGQHSTFKSVFFFVGHRNDLSFIMADYAQKKAERLLIEESSSPFWKPHPVAYTVYLIYGGPQSSAHSDHFPTTPDIASLNGAIHAGRTLLLSRLV